MKSIQAGAYFHKIILTKFDKINFQKLLAPDNDAKTKVGGDGQLFLKQDFMFFSHPKDA